MPEPTPKGQIGGHEGIGVVSKVGSGVTEVKVGDRVGVKWITSACLICDECMSGLDGRCAKRKVSGYKAPGTFQQYVISDPRYVTPIPDGIESAQAAPLLCGGLTVYAALLKAECKTGDWIGLSGAGGGLGHLAIQYCKVFGLQVLAIDHGSKADFCLGLGADAFLDFTQYKGDELAMEAKRVTGGGCRAMMVCNASSHAYDQALDMVRYAGTLVCVGVPEIDPRPIKQALPWKLIVNQFNIKGAVTGNRKQAIQCLQPAARGLIKPAIRIEPMSSLTQIFDEMHAGTIHGRVVLDLSRE